jgi:hypothetical protein
VPSNYAGKVGWGKRVESKPIVADEPVCLDRNCDVGNRENISEHIVLRTFTPHSVKT